MVDGEGRYDTGGGNASFLGPQENPINDVIACSRIADRVNFWDGVE